MIVFAGYDNVLGIVKNNNKNYKKLKDIDKYLLINERII
jgi:hypothetical protein